MSAIRLRLDISAMFRLNKSSYIFTIDCKQQCSAGDACWQMFHRGQRTVQQLSASARLVSDMELRLNRNITSSVARSLQELSSAFRSSQSAYLKSMHSFVLWLWSFHCCSIGAVDSVGRSSLK